MSWPPAKPSDKTRERNLLLFSLFAQTILFPPTTTLFSFYKSEKGFEGQSLNLNEFGARFVCANSFLFSGRAPPTSQLDNKFLSK
jgi:hypothetical protein